jgi:FtsH-binding integral membrane protein
MSTQYDPRTALGRTGVEARADIDQGLRSYMLGVYNNMAVGVALTGLVAYAFGNFAPLSQLIVSPVTGRPTIFFYIAAFSPLALVFLFGAAVNRLSAWGVNALFFGFAALMGVSLSTIFMVYTDASIAKVFFITAATFASLSLWGYTTKKDLSGWGTFLFMGVIGLIIASLVNIFLKSSMMSFVISVIGVLVFSGLTAYDTQRIKEMYFAGDDSETMGKKIAVGAFALYTNFINLFMMLMQLFGQRE